MNLEKEMEKCENKRTLSFWELQIHLFSGGYWEIDLRRIYSNQERKTI